MPIEAMPKKPAKVEPNAETIVLSKKEAQKPLPSNETRQWTPQEQEEAQSSSSVEWEVPLSHEEVDVKAETISKEDLRRQSSRLSQRESSRGVVITKEPEAPRPEKSGQQALREILLGYRQLENERLTDSTRSRVPEAMQRFVQSRPDQAEREAQFQKKVAEMVKERALGFDLPDALAESLGDRWLLLDRLGRGGMGEVFDAYDLRLRRPSVVKFTRSRDVPLSEHTRTRFNREKKSQADFASNYIARIFDAGESETGAWMALEKIDGPTLREQMSLASFSEEQAAKAAVDIIEALSKVHASGRVFRDLKPANVMYDQSEGHYKLIDFGLAKDLEEDVRRDEWLSSQLRALVSGQAKLDTLRVTGKSKAEIKKLLDRIKDSEVRQQFGEGKVQVADFDSSFQQEFEKVSQNVQPEDDSAHVEMLSQGIQIQAAQYLARQITNMLIDERHDVLPVGVLRAGGDFVHALKRDGYLQNLLAQDRLDEAEAYISERPGMATLTKELSREWMREDLTQDTIVGTPMYMPPEQVRAAARVDKQADVYALGAMLYEMLEGETPHRGKTAIEVFTSVLQDEPSPLSRNDISPDVVRLVMRMLDKDPQKRPSLEQVKAILKPHVPSTKNERVKRTPKPATLQSFFADIQKDVRRDKSKRASQETVTMKPSAQAVKPTLFGRIRKFFTGK